jgi:ABC-type lipoprotein release transport system permease subunit
MLLAFAARNLGRQWQRTLATGGAVLFGVAALVFVDAWTRGIEEAIREYAATTRLGSIQIHGAGYFARPDSFPLDVTIQTDGPVFEQIKRVAGVEAVAPRINLSGTASNGTDETMFLATAIDPSSEQRVCPRFLEGDLRAGRSLRPEDGDAVVIGTGLATSLALRVGSALTLETRDAAGRMNAVDVEVVGIAASSLPDEAKWLVVMTLATAQRLARLEYRATSLVLRVADMEQVDRTADEVRHALIRSDGAELGRAAQPSSSSSSAKEAGAFEVRTWRETGLYFEQAIRTFAFAQHFLLALLLTLAVLVVLNAFAVTVHEREVEFATLMALGAPRLQVLTVLVLEAVCLGLIAGACGAFCGACAASIAATIGVPFEPPNQPAVVVRPDWRAAFVAAATVAAVVTCALGSLGPATFASRRRPAELFRR